MKKTQTQEGENKMLSLEYKRRVIQAQIETQRKLDKELTYSLDLQKKDMVCFYEEHLVKLTAMLLDK